MKLWSDYEGRTIADAYPLKKLVRPEGRSAFFLTTNGTGTPSLVRIIEAHFDESEILERWKAVSAISQENLLTMRKFGETELDGTPLVYAVLEPTDISLAELLQTRTLTAEETEQLATSLMAALQALHSREMVHGQLDAENILAVGETVKLRSDCVHEAVKTEDGPTAAELKAQDAHALAVVLLQSLTGRTSLQGSATLLPSPFDGIIRNGLSGRWGMPEMAAALEPVMRKQAAARTAAAAVKEKALAQATAVKEPAATDTSQPVAGSVPSAATPVAAAAQKPVASASPISASDAKTPAPAPRPEPIKMPAVPAPIKTGTAVQENLFAAAKPVVKPSDLTNSPATVAASLSDRAEATQAPDVRHRIVQPVAESDPRRNRLWIAIAAAVLLVLVIGWRMLRTEPTTSATASKPISTLANPAPANGSSAPATPTYSKPSATRYAKGKGPAINPAPAAPAARTRAASNVASNASVPVVTGGAGAKTQWRVVAYTYNKEDQAQQKAQALQKQHPSMNAEVFSPTGHAPYLVTVGGAMSHDQAESLRNKVRGEGLPRDTYLQNYSR